MNRFIRNTGFYLLIFLVTVGIVQFFIAKQDTTKELSYNELVAAAQQGDVQTLTLQVQNGTYLITGEFKPKAGSEKGEAFAGRAPLADYVPELFTNLGIEKNFEVLSKKMPGQSFWLTFLTSIIPFIIMFVLFFFLINQAQGGGGKVMNFGKSRARL